MRYHPYKYEIKTLRGLQISEGILLEEGGAYSLIHPWEYLGDAPLYEHLRDLRQSRSLPLTQRALELLEKEKKAKEAHLQLWTSLSPSSHLQLSSIRDFEYYLSEGFCFFKFKIAADTDLEIDIFTQLEAYLKRTPFKIRLDANQKFTLEQARRYFARFSDTLLSAIDFVEDPILGSPEEWLHFSNEFELRLAHDFAPDSHREVCDIWVLKPSRYNPWPLVEKAAHDLRRVVISHSFDHTLGQVVAASEATAIEKLHPLLVDTCALLSFEEQSVDKILKRKSTQLDMSSLTGFGYGMDTALSQINWIDL